MPSIRLIPIVIVCLVPLLASARQVPGPEQAPAPAPAPVVLEKSAAESRLEFAIVGIRVLERIAAKIDMDVDMLNQKFKLEGNYYKDTGHRIRLQLNLIGLGDTNSKMVQVCDGKVLWDFQQVLNMRSYRKREILPILEKLKDPNLDEAFRIAITSNMGFGGPEAMLSGLMKSVGFDQMGEERIDDVDYVVIRGTWRDRSTLLNANDQPLPPTASLPSYIPSSVAIYLGKLDGWPHRIEMIGKAPLLMEDTRATDPATGRPIGQPRKPPKVDPSRVTLRYKLLPTTEISAGQFQFEAPANVAATSVKDDTEEFLAGLDQYIQIQIAQKKAAAAKAGEEQPLLKARPIEVPSAPAEGLPGILPAPEGTPK